MKIGFIGYGNMSRVLSKRWAPAHEVFIGGRNADQAAALAQEIDAVGSGSIAEAVQQGDVVVMATPAFAVEEAIASAGGAAAFAGKILIDMNNPVSVPGGPHDTSGEYYLPRLFDEGSLAERIAALVPDCAVVKAFNMAQASVWEMDPPLFDGRKLVALYCGDDEAAKATVAGLIAELGCDPVDAGTLAYSRLLEASAGLVIKFLFEGHDARTVLNLIQPEVKPI
ncbi:MAG: NAD(P)-binding domain-containing protein [Pseudomonadota bacterium]